MVQPSKPTSAILQNYQGIGVPEASLAVILQRGGDELLLSKVPNRFTVRPSATASASNNWAAKTQAKLNRRVGQSNLEEYLVVPENLDLAMQAARASDAVAFASHVYCPANNPSTFFYLTDRITIQFGEQVNEESRWAIANAANLTIVRPVEGIPNTFVCEVTKQATENPIKIANRLTRYPEVSIAEPNILIETQQHYTPRDPLYPKQWYLNNQGGDGVVSGAQIYAEPAWDITRGARSIVIAIADDSVDLTHPDFQGQGKIVSPIDFKDGDTSPMPVAESDNHGTSCAGVAAAEENGQGTVGVAPGCALMPIRTTGFLDDESIEKIFNWAVEKGAAVISCSWGAGAVYYPLSLRQSAAITKAATKGRGGRGCVILFAAGNANRPVNGAVDEKGWPNNMFGDRTKWLAGFAVHPDVIAVSASTSLNKKAAYSNWGTSISVCAPSNNAPPGTWLPETGFIATGPEVSQYLPGLGVFAADRVGVVGYDSGDYTNSFGGTSSATPVVAGVAALVLSANPRLTAREVRGILEQTADKIVDPDPDPQLGNRRGNYDATSRRSDWFGYGKVNAFKAVQAAVRKAGGNPNIGGSRFSDISGHWAEKFIEALAAANIISGFPDGSFGPDNSLNRAQYAALLVSAFSPIPKVAATNFVDVSASFWARSAIERANRAGFLSGFPGLKFGPNQNLTKTEAIVSLVNGLELKGGNPDVLKVYSDRAQIPNFALSAAATATALKIVVNYPARDRLSPQRDITRAEISALIYQTLVAINRAKAIDSPYIV
ncbi:MAG: S8 family serine peptidase [Microcoleus sp. PH2017_10_PVI_O_A]|uniref:S8 family serine peptidase n=1 Tax=unclassified Microcoleus TaxID=2642155 RepID=UPI001DE52685|nr:MULTISPECIES: S8 family serine peptidase [unclassified Microcoleus]TAE79663.1 MAG: peptidase S8 [Oscillatoriales cyanobacterium]MCC3408023.1 S8 family serine peptidase [Microcoleus sp. PH2017_10_PVI_O_A]MCC3460103.1 S8 family serine peptidase [Microcoleus sp. PH2017_11_PCY_U_A]MCC3480165.1 S8 family serine peptidase [Microcoleus sp. PH2017_12_PCY_D_A]MCC3528014.1 S8 family serine peptidase [Microcoleus sp. PH2017_21_RUC_O_A]